MTGMTKVCMSTKNAQFRSRKSAAGRGIVPIKVTKGTKKVTVAAPEGNPRGLEKTKGESKAVSWGDKNQRVSYLLGVTDGKESRKEKGGKRSISWLAD